MTTGSIEEARAFEELHRLYNYADDDSRQFTRWQMLTAIEHGRRLALTPPEPQADLREDDEPAAWAIEAERVATEAYASYMGDPDGDDTHTARMAAAKEIERHAIIALSSPRSGGISYQDFKDAAMTRFQNGLALPGDEHLFEGSATGAGEGYAAGIEAAAKVAESHAVELTRRIGGKKRLRSQHDLDVYDSAISEARAIATAIKALAPTTDDAGRGL